MADGHLSKSIRGTMVEHKSMKTALTYSFVSHGLLWLGKTESPRISDQSPSTRVDDQRRSTKHRPPISANGPDRRFFNQAHKTNAQFCLPTLPVCLDQARRQVAKGVINRRGVEILPATSPTYPAAFCRRFGFRCMSKTLTCSKDAFLL